MIYLKRIQPYSGQFYTVLIGPISLAGQSSYPADATHAILSPKEPSWQQVDEVLSKGEFVLVN